MIVTSLNVSLLDIRPLPKEIDQWLSLLRDHSPENAEHTERTAKKIQSFLKYLRFMNTRLIEQMRLGAMLHDIGKIRVPQHLLLKQGELTKEDWAEIRRHPTHAFEILTEAGLSGPLIEIAHCHHERWDGKGYPNGLSENDIPVSARIFALVDQHDALIHPRSYRNRQPDLDEVRFRIGEERGRTFDPDIANLFLEYISPVACGRDQQH